MLEDDHVEELERGRVQPRTPDPDDDPARRPASRVDQGAGPRRHPPGAGRNPPADVSVAYTNICLLDVLNTSLGGELLGDSAIGSVGLSQAGRGWPSPTARGIAFEWNSPTYGAVDIRVFKLLADLTWDDETRIERGRPWCTGQARCCTSMRAPVAGPGRTVALSPVGRLRDAADRWSWARLAGRRCVCRAGSPTPRCRSRPFEISETADASLAGRWGSPPTTAHRLSWGRRRRNTPASRMC